MKSICLAAFLAAFLAALVTGCAATWPSAGPAANNQAAQQPAAADTRSPQPIAGAQPGDDPQPKSQKLVVRTGYPDTRLILPWFLSGPIDYVNSH